MPAKIVPAIEGDAFGKLNDNIGRRGKRASLVFDDVPTAHACKDFSKAFIGLAWGRLGAAAPRPLRFALFFHVKREIEARARLAVDSCILAKVENASVQLCLDLAVLVSVKIVRSFYGVFPKAAVGGPV